MPRYIVIFDPHDEMGDITRYGPVFVVRAESKAEARKSVKRVSPSYVEIKNLKVFNSETTY